MSDRPAIALTGVGKRYTLYPTRADSLLDALGLAGLVPGRRKKYQRFWALRGVNLNLPRGSRVGIVGRNGAGKSTLLKLITQNVAPTEGTVEVHGEVQALLQTGTGMHPDFTGYQNIHAALTYQGLTAAEIRDAVADIEEFTELGAFLSQPVKSYSTGMQARLAFATATKVKPDVLIIDEVLGVGDGYFLAKSTERIQRLIDSGATVLLVSHAMDQILKFCSEAVWIDRGQVMGHGDALDIVREYEQYLRLLDERRLLARNAARQAGGPVADGTPFADAFQVRVTAPAGSRVRVSTVTLEENDRVQETVRVGGPQDGAVGNAAGAVLTAGSRWSEPIEGKRPCREVSGGTAEVVFRLYHYDASVRYRVAVQCQAEGEPGTIELVRQGSVLATVRVEPGRDWDTANLEPATTAAPKEEGPSAVVPLRHWPGLGDLRIERVRLLGPDGEERAAFPFGGTLTVEVTVQATAAGVFPFRPNVALFRRSDGVLVSQQTGEATSLTVAAGDRRVARLRLGPLILGNDTYVFSVGLYRKLDVDGVEPPERYDAIDRGFEFQVYGREGNYRALVQHPGHWEVAADPVAVCRSA
jgi:lipopolysaccharide transport system ATP-binding protein